MPSPAIPHRSRLASLALTPVLLLCGCLASPREDERGPLVSARRVLGIDFSVRSAARRAEDLAQMRHVALVELRRSPDWGDAADGAQAELRRPATLLSDAGQFGSAELRRRPEAPGWLLPGRAEFSRSVSDDLDLVRRSLGFGPRPLNEPDDRVHRTDHDDDRPEATLWQRLSRRLGL